MIIGKGQLGIKQHWEAWMKFNPRKNHGGMHWSEAVKKLEDLGNPILEVDKVRHRIKVLNEVSE